MKLLCDLHTHTIAGGHAYSTLKENIESAYERGLKVYGFSEHGPKMPGGPHYLFFHNFKIIPRTYKEMKILRGCEANIMDLDGRLDLKNGVLKKLDYVIASLHILCVHAGDAKENTDCLIKVMDHPYVNIIGHPDDSRYPLEYERLVLAAKEKSVLLEINNSSLNPQASREGARENIKTLLHYCKKYEVPVIVASDSHYYDSIGRFEAAEALLEEEGFPEELVMNTKIEALLEFLNYSADSSVI